MNKHGLKNPEPTPFFWVASSHIGCRSEQQDGCAVESKGDALLAVVCDGAGGHQGGAMASKAAVAAVVRVFLAFPDKAGISEALALKMAEEANSAVAGLEPELGHAHRPRSTLAALIVKKGCARWVHVGDSRVYHLRRGRIETRTKDHSVVQMLVRQGEITEEEMGTHPSQGRLLRALGSVEEFKPTLGECELEHGDAFLLCSDGFWERIRDGEIEAFFQKPSQGALDGWVLEAVVRNGPKSDNVTAVAVWSDPVIPTPHSRRSPLVLSAIFLLLALASATLAIVFQRDKPPELKTEPQTIVERAGESPIPTPVADSTPQDILKAYGEDENPPPTPEQPVPAAETPAASPVGSPTAQDSPPDAGVSEAVATPAEAPTPSSSATP
jgi:serine/threonine protein phosphatase PrpC